MHNDSHYLSSQISISNNIYQKNLALIDKLLHANVTTDCITKRSLDRTNYRLKNKAFLGIDRYDSDSQIVKLITIIVIIDYLIDFYSIVYGSFTVTGDYSFEY